MIILTAFNSEFAEIGSLCVRSINAYCRKFGRIHKRIRQIPADYGRKPSWKKMDLIRELLPTTDYVLWIDADAMIVGKEDFRTLIKPVTLNIAKDLHGINGGVVAWKNCQQSFDAFDRIESLYEEFKDDPWFEQKPLMTFVDELDVHYQEKRVWNAFGKGVTGESDVCEETMIIHWPGMSVESRLPLMEEVARSL